MALLILPGAWWLGQSWVELVLLIGVVVAVLVVELLNTAVESAIDRVGSEWHALSKRFKDIGSAAVLLSLLRGLTGEPVQKRLSPAWRG